MSSISVPLASLVLSPRNVRQTTAEHDTSDLEQSIPEHGLLTPLTVHPMPRKKYGVTAGGRRLRAMQALAERKVIDAKTFQVDVIVRDEDDATLTELSIVENTARVALPPATEFRAFARLADEGKTPAEIAARFATTELHVRQRERLGRLAPALLEALEAERITLDLAKAFAATTDIDLQLRVWNAGARSVADVRSAMNRDLVNAGVDRMLELVGIDAYTAAGGQADQDLWNQGAPRVRDVEILKRLYDARLGEELDDLQLPTNVTVQLTTEGVGQVLDAGQPTAAQRVRLDEIDARTEEISSRLEAIAAWVDDGPAQRLVADASESQDEVDRLVAENLHLEAEADKIWDGDLGSLGPVIAVADIRGGALSITGYYRPFGWRPDHVPTTVTKAELDAQRAGGATAPAPTVPQARPTSGALGAAAGTPLARELAGLPVVNGFRSDRLGMSSVYRQPEEVAKAEHGLTKDAVEAMRSHHRQILAAAVLNGPTEQRLAAGALVFVLARGILRESGWGERSRQDPVESRLGVAGVPSHAYDPVTIGAELAEQPGAKRQQAAVDQVRQMDWMREPDDAQALRLFTRAGLIDKERAAAAVFAAMLSRTLGVAGFRSGIHDVIAELLDIGSRVRTHWTPDVRFFERLPKARMVEAIRAVDEGAAKRLGTLGTDELAKAAAAIMAGTREAADKYGLSEEALHRARRWVPPYLSFAPPDSGDSPEIDQEDEEDFGQPDLKRLHDEAEKVDFEKPFWMLLGLRKLDSGEAFGRDPHNLKTWLLYGGGMPFCTTAPGHMAITGRGRARLAELEAMLDLAPTSEVAA